MLLTKRGERTHRLVRMFLFQNHLSEFDEVWWAVSTNNTYVSATDCGPYWSNIPYCNYLVNHILLLGLYSDLIKVSPADCIICRALCTCWAEETLQKISCCALENAYCYVQCILRVISLGLRWPGPEADLSSPSSVEVRNEWSYTPNPPTYYHGLHRETQRYDFVSRTAP
jgi:hypothetical protein